MSSKKLFIDTSVVFKWLQTQESDHLIAKQIYQDIIAKKITIYAPELLRIEIANVLATKSAINEKLLEKTLLHYQSLPVKIITIDNASLNESALLAKKYHTSVYDMLYAVLAKKYKCPLITADRKFIAKTNFEHVVELGDYQS